MKSEGRTREGSSARPGGWGGSGIQQPDTGEIPNLTPWDPVPKRTPLQRHRCPLLRTLRTEDRCNSTFKYERKQARSGKGRPGPCKATRPTLRCLTLAGAHPGGFLGPAPLPPQSFPGATTPQQSPRGLQPLAGPWRPLPETLQPHHSELGGRAQEFAAAQRPPLPGRTGDLRWPLPHAKPWHLPLRPQLHGALPAVPYRGQNPTPGLRVPPLPSAARALRPGVPVSMHSESPVPPPGQTTSRRSQGAHRGASPGFPALRAPPYPQGPRTARTRARRRRRRPALRAAAAAWWAAGLRAP